MFYSRYEKKQKPKNLFVFKLIKISCIRCAIYIYHDCVISKTMFPKKKTIMFRQAMATVSNLKFKRTN